MKKIKILYLSIIFVFVLSACESGPLSSNSTDIKSPEPVTLSEEQIAENNFISDIGNISISITKTPKSTNVNKDFNANYEIEVKDTEGNIKNNYPISISYPISKENDKYNFVVLNDKTDENGKYIFKAPTPTFAANTKITVYPTPVSENVKQNAMEKSVSAEWKVKSDIISRGAVLFVWDFNEKDKPVNNSYNLLSEFKKQQILLVGNAPVNETSYIGKPISTLYKENYEIIENAYGYLIVGTIKFTKPVEKCDDGFLCSLISDIQVVDMKTGNVVFSSTFTNEATGSNWNNCVSTCKDELSVQIVDSIVYGL